ncbi:MAG: sigma-70 family RNA polymerase sigma factor [Pirellulales bacterium]
MRETQSCQTDTSFTNASARRSSTSLQTPNCWPGSVPKGTKLCRRVLNNTHDSEDAFQTAFLVLARKSGSIRKPELLANWLYGVAYRVALKARQRAARRTVCERQAQSMPVAEPTLEVAWQEVRRVLDEELNRLPDKYRSALVLCYLEGLTHEEAAARLGCPPGSISWRLERGRVLLRSRLTRRGLTLSAGLLTLLFSGHASAAVPSTLVESTVRSALVLASDHAAVETLPESVVELLRESIKELPAARLQSLGAVVALALLLIGAAALTCGVVAAVSPPAQPRPPGRGIAAQVIIPSGVLARVAVVGPSDGREPAAFAGDTSGEPRPRSPLGLTSAALGAGTAGGGRLGHGGLGVGGCDPWHDPAPDDPGGSAAGLELGSPTALSPSCPSGQKLSPGGS